MISQVQTNSGIFISVILGARMLRMVVMMLIEPRIELMPSRCTAKMVRSMPMPICTVSGAYMVQPTPGALPGMKNDSTSSVAANGSSQNDQLLEARERHVGRADHHRDLPVREADEHRHDRAEHHDQAVHGGELVEEVRVGELQPGVNSSRRMPTAISPPIENMMKLNHRYSVPMSLWLVVVIQRMIPPYGPWWPWHVYRRACNRDRERLRSCCVSLSICAALSSAACTSLALFPQELRA